MQLQGGVHVHGRGVWGACVTGGVHVSGHEWWGACVAGGMHGRGHVCHACPPYTMRYGQSMCGWYASYWNAFLFFKTSGMQ